MLSKVGAMIAECWPKNAKSRRDEKMNTYPYTRNESINLLTVVDFGLATKSNSCQEDVSLIMARVNTFEHDSRAGFSN